jgi:peptidoglycan hydrolase CwlO-like protein
MSDDDVNHIVTKDEASEIRARQEFVAGLNEARKQFTKTIDAKDAEIARLRAELNAKAQHELVLGQEIACLRTELEESRKAAEFQRLRAAYKDRARQLAQIARETLEKGSLNNG